MGDEANAETVKATTLPVSPLKETLRTFAPLAIALIALAVSMGWLSKEQADTISKVIPILVAEKQTDEPQAVIAEDTSTAAMTPEQWAELIRGIIEQMKPTPQPTPVDPPQPTPKPINPVPQPLPTGLAILVSDELGKPITSSTIEAGALFRVSALGAKGEVGWQSVKSGDVRLSTSIDGQEFIGYLSPGQWVDFGLTDYESRKQLSVRISCNQGPRPPPHVLPVDPVDPPGPEPRNGKVSLAVVYDVKAITPETAIVLNATDAWNEFTASGSEWIFYDRTTQEPLSKQAVSDAGATGLPVLVIYAKDSRELLASIPLPKSVDDLKATVAKYTGSE